MELRDLKNIVISVPTVTRETTLRQLMDTMSQSHTSVLPVVEGSSIVGVVTEGDLLRLIKVQPLVSVEAVFVKELPRHIEGRMVGEILTHNPLVVSPASDVEEIIKKMAAGGVKSALVVEGGKLLGIAKLLDIMRKYYAFR